MKDLKIYDRLKQTLSVNFAVNEAQVERILKLFNSVLKPEIEKNYLSHLKSALEDLINERRKEIFLSELKEDNGIKPEHKSTLTKMVMAKKVRLFTILLKPIDSKIRLATTRIIDNNALIVYYSGLDDKQKRILIAHELGHIAFKQLGSAEILHNENSVNVFAALAMIDKNNFYKSHASNFTYLSDNDVIASVNALCNKPEK